MLAPATEPALSGIRPACATRGGQPRTAQQVRTRFAANFEMMLVRTWCGCYAWLSWRIRASGNGAQHFLSRAPLALGTGRPSGSTSLAPTRYGERLLIFRSVIALVGMLSIVAGSCVARLSKPTWASKLGLTINGSVHLEQAVCSNAGLCDATSGVCTCFPGFTGSMCEKGELSRRQ